MIPRVILSVVLCAAITLGSFPVMGRQANFAPAAFDTYEITLVDGGSLTVRLVGGRCFFASSKDQKYNVTLSKAKSTKIVKTFKVSGETFDVELASLMDEDVLYNVTISYEAFGMEVNNGDNIIFKRGRDIYFWKSANYEYNLETAAELWTDEQSLMECLEPQNDVECDDPVLIAYSDRIVGDAKDDWEKVFRIYKFISSEMAYDDTEAETSSAGFQDSAVNVIRAGRAICEGFANAFVALCRAQGIPAVVEFGIGYSDYKAMTTKKPTASDYADHAWAAVFLGGKWLFVDPTYDMSRFYHGPKDIRVYEESTKYYLLSLEAFSNDHMIYDADTRHGLPKAGYCGDETSGVRFEITRDGVCHIMGAGTLSLPSGITGFHTVVFEEGSYITEIAYGCFCDCDLLTTVILPDSVTTIDDYAFCTCEDLQYIYIPESCTYIGEDAFLGCDELSYVRIPDACTTIGDGAFDGCPRLYISVPTKVSDFSDAYKRKPMYIERR